MLWDLMEWLQLPNLSAVAAQRKSDLVLLLYILSFKRSWLFAMAFLFCQMASDFSYLGVFNTLPQDEYAVCFYLSTVLIWSITVRSQITLNMNKSLAAWCSIMILFLLLMAWDSWANADTETYIYANYSNIIVCIHGGLILSLYRPSAFIDLLVDNIRRGCDWCRRSYSVQFICYTVAKYKQTMAQKWLVRKQQL